MVKGEVNDQLPLELAMTEHGQFLMKASQALKLMHDAKNLHCL
ncbi:unnamed protein product [Brugia timori]|uniref:Uncharacterized protein n=1 Tax=Brugia timori TaxID=42155 RepID=A0A3P7TEH4_9BILA|nr:unnamed protein product [Brugia timori]